MIAEVSIEGADNAGNYTFRLISLEGKVIQIENLSGAKHSIDLSGVEKGLYIYEIMQPNKKILSNKLIILE